MHPSLCGNPTEDCHPRMHYESGFINNWWDETAIRRRIAKEGTGKPTANNLTLSLSNAIPFQERNLFRTYPETLIPSNHLIMTADSCVWNCKNTAHKLRANPGGFQIANVSCSLTPPASLSNLLVNKAMMHTHAICWQSWWLNRWGGCNGCVRQRWSRDSGQGVCVEAHQVRPPCSISPHRIY